MVEQAAVALVSRALGASGKFCLVQTTATPYTWQHENSR